MTAMEQQIAALQGELVLSQQHVGRLGTALDELRSESSTAIANLRSTLEALRKERSEGRDGKSRRLINTKNLEPKHFGGKDEENYKEWAKAMKNFLNTQKSGFRKILEWAEESANVIDEDDVDLMMWEHATEANEALYDYLCMVTVGKALVLVEQVPERGYEAWRLLANRYNPAGGQMELAKMQHLLHKTAVKTITELPSAVDAFEREVEMYNKRNPDKFPEPWKLPILLELIPASHKRELTMRYGMGERDYKKMRDQIVEFANENRVMKNVQNHRGQSDMEVDSTEVSVNPAGNQDYTEEDFQQYAENLEAELYYLGQKGKGKGKSSWWSPTWSNKGAGKGKGNKGQPWSPWPSKGPGKGKGEDHKDVVCFWCQKKGHMKKDCRAFLAGKPKIPASRGANSLDQPSPDWEDDLTAEAGSLEPVESLEIDSDDTEDDDQTLQALLMESNNMKEMTLRNAQKRSKRRACQDKCGCSAKFFPLNVASTDDEDSEDPDFETEDDNEVKAPSRTPVARTKMDLIQKSAAESKKKEKLEVSPSSEASVESIGELIAREQRELKEKNAWLFMPPGLNSAEKSPTESGGPSKSPLMSCAAKLQEVDNQNVAEDKKKKKNRNKSAKRQLIKILDEVEEDIKACGDKREIEVQTDVSLPNKMLNLMWVPSCLDPVFDGVESEAEEEKVEEKTEALSEDRLWPPGLQEGVLTESRDNKEHVKVMNIGSGMDDIDNLEEMTNNEECWQESKAESVLHATGCAIQSECAFSRSACALGTHKTPSGQTRVSWEPTKRRLVEVPAEGSGEKSCTAPYNFLASLLDHEKFMIIAVTMLIFLMMAIMAVTSTQSQDVSLDTVDDKKQDKSPEVRKRRMKLRRGITMDSGAANPVMPKRMIRDPSKIRPSKASRMGVHYVAANNGRIPNEGETTFKFKTSDGHDIAWDMQIAEVNKALGAISYLVDNNHRVVFDKDMATGKDLSLMLNKGTKQVDRFRRDRNVWVLDATVDEDDVPGTHFHRQA